MCTGDCREANLRGWMQAQGSTIKVDVHARDADSGFQFRSCTPEVSPHAWFMLLLPLDRVAGRPVGRTWPQTHPSVIRGSMAARNHNYDASRHISLPMTAKQGLETYRERHKTRIFTLRAAFLQLYTARTATNQSVDCFLTRL